MDKCHSNVRVVIAGLMASDNLGDLVISECLKAGLELNGCYVEYLDMSAGSVAKYNKERPHKHSNGLSKSRNLKSILIDVYRCIPESIQAYLAWSMPKHHNTKKKWDAIIANSDIVVVGGGQIITNGSAPRVVEVLRYARRHKKKIAIFSVGVSADIRWFSAWKLYKQMANSSWVSSRDVVSKNRLKSINNKFFSIIRVTPDPALLCSEVYVNNASLKKNTSIGFNVQNLIDLKVYMDRLGITDADVDKIINKTINYFLSSGFEVAIFTNGDARDYAYSEDIYEKFHDNAMVTLKERPHTADHLIRLVSQNCFNFCFRMHSAIISSSYEIPFLIIPWDEKIYGVMQAIGLEHYIVDDEFLTNDDPRLREFILKNALTEFVYNGKPYRDTLKKHIQGVLL